MAKTPCTQSTDTHYGRFIGRVGGLAVALGIGVAIANNPGVASAEDGQSAGPEKQPQPRSPPTRNRRRRDANPVKSAVKELHSRFAEAREKAESTRAERQQPHSEHANPAGRRASHKNLKRRPSPRLADLEEHAQAAETGAQPRLGGGSGLRAPRTRTRRHPRQGARIRRPGRGRGDTNFHDSSGQPAGHSGATRRRADGHRNREHAAGSVDEARPQGGLVRHRAERIQ